MRPGPTAQPPRRAADCGPRQGRTAGYRQPACWRAGATKTLRDGNWITEPFTCLSACARPPWKSGKHALVEPCPARRRDDPAKPDRRFESHAKLAQDCRECARLEKIDRNAF